jgi:hypothetical protein
MKSKSFGAGLDKIMDGFTISIDDSYDHIAKQAVKKAIIDLVRELVPDKWSPRGSEPELTEGWNSCRQTILDKMGEV